MTTIRMFPNGITGLIGGLITGSIASGGIFNQSTRLKNKPKLNCKLCGKQFTNINRQKVYCSEECRIYFNKIYHKSEMLNPNWKILNIGSWKFKRKINCRACKKPFMRTHANQKYCSSECLENRSIIHRTHLTSRKCKYCGFLLVGASRNGFCWDCVKILRSMVDREKYFEKGVKNE